MASSFFNKVLQSGKASQSETASRKNTGISPAVESLKKNVKKYLEEIAGSPSLIFSPHSGQMTA